MSNDNNDVPVPGGMFIRGGTSTRQENMGTELWLPAAQSLLRASVDCLAAFLVLSALVILGRYVIWILVAGILFSDRYQVMVDGFLSRLSGPPAWFLDKALGVIKWGWIVGGGLVALNVLIPVTWTMTGELWIQNAVLAPAWPLLFWRAPWAEIPFGGFMRMVVLILCVVPLASWQPLRDRMKWALWEFTPFGPVNVAESGIDPHNWKPRVEPAPAPVVQSGANVIIERVDYNPHETIVAEGVAISNGSGTSLHRIDMGWVSHEQWRSVAEILLIKNQPFLEQFLGRGLVFPTHGPEDLTYGGKLGFRFFRQQCLDAGLIAMRGNHENSGFVLTLAGENFLRKWLEPDADTRAFDAQFEEHEEEDYDE